MFRLFCVFSVFFIGSYSLLWVTCGGAAPLFVDLFAVVVPMAALFGPLSFAFFNFLEGVIKDLPRELRLSKPDAYAGVVCLVADLKKEIIVNVVLVLMLFFIVFVVSRVEVIIAGSHWVAPIWFLWAGMALKGACVLTCLAAVIIQLQGFIIANELRTELAMGVK